MSESKIQKLGGFSRFVICESNSKRLYKLLRLYQEKTSDTELTNLISSTLDAPLLSRILKDSNFWLPFEIENQILEKLAENFPLHNYLYLLGEEFFISDVLDIFPSDNLQIDFFEMLSRFPLLIDKYIRYLKFNLLEIMDNGIKVKLSFDEYCNETSYDLYFLRGLLNGAAHLFQVKNFTAKILRTRLGNHFDQQYFLVNSDTIFHSNFTELELSWEEAEIQVGKTSINKSLSSLETKTFVISKKEKDETRYSYIDISSILDKTNELYIENRDLEAAVEVLKNLRNELVIKQKSITKDLKIARNIQRGIIPQKIPDWQGLQFGVSFIPMQEVSGDYYDYFNFGSNRLGILLSDVSGHGVPAAFITAISKLLFTNYKLDSPSEILGNANTELLDLVKQQGYLTCFYGIVNSEYEMTYSIAGHPRPILFKYKEKEIIILEGEGTFLGMFDDAREHFKDYKIRLEPGDKLFIFTDGLVEGLSDTGEQFQQENLIKHILETYSMNVKDSIEHIMKNFHKFSRGTDQGDDITLLCVGLSLKLEEFDTYRNNSDRFFQEKNYQAAAENLLKANQILPNDLNVLLLLGKCYTKIQNYTEAIIYLEEYNSLKTYNADSHLILGYCFYKLKNYGRAEMELQKSISLRSSNLPALVILIKTMIKQNYLEKALDISEKVIAIDSENKQAQSLKRYILSKLK
jgi:serine phosphatase RsbU (regulator of sigma subunit)